MPVVTNSSTLYKALSSVDRATSKRLLSEYLKKYASEMTASELKEARALKTTQEIAEWLTPLQKDFKYVLPFYREYAPDFFVEPRSRAPAKTAKGLYPTLSLSSDSDVETLRELFDERVRDLTLEYGLRSYNSQASFKNGKLVLTVEVEDTGIPPLHGIVTRSGIDSWKAHHKKYRLPPSLIGTAVFIKSQPLLLVGINTEHKNPITAINALSKKKHNLSVKQVKAALGI